MGFSMLRTIFIGQAMPRVKRDPHDWPSLNAWVYSIGITQDQIRANFHYTALVNYFPGSKKGSHLVPSLEEIKKERERLKKTIQNFNPELVVPIGKLSISYCLNQNQLSLNQNIGKIFNIDPYQALGFNVPVIPLPHPSGASTWRHKPQNQKLLLQALNLLKSALKKKKLRQATICLLRKKDKVLLAMKKRGFGAGKWNGVGGKVKDGETIKQAAIRETQEEIGVTLQSLEKVAVLDFYFPDVPEEKEWGQQVTVFITDKWEGEPKESEEMAPRWFKIEDFPYNQMWSDDIHWMPKVLSGQKIKGRFIFSGEGELKEHHIENYE